MIIRATIRIRMSRRIPNIMPMAEISDRDKSQGMAKHFIRHLMKAKPPIRKSGVSISL